MPKTKKGATERQKEQMKNLYNVFLNDLGTNIMSKRRKNEIVEYRSLFNTICKKGFRIRFFHISDFYRENGRGMEHGSIMNSVSKFNLYAKDAPELLMLLNYIKPSLNKVIDTKVVLTSIQKLVSDLTEDQNYELTELITLRKKSWEWKSKNKAKEYMSY